VSEPNKPKVTVLVRELFTPEQVQKYLSKKPLRRPPPRPPKKDEK
jgi:hypothetical protein